jgi:hypothetical protein
LLWKNHCGLSLKWLKKHREVDSKDNKRQFELKMAFYSVL